MPKRRADRPKKRRFHGNRYTKAPDTTETMTETNRTLDENLTASEKKLTVKEDFCESIPELSGYRFFDLEIFIPFMSKFPCPMCKTVSGFKVNEFRRGLYSLFTFRCLLCEHEIKLANSYIEHRSVASINTRFAISMCNIGKNYHQSKRFLANMDMPPIMSQVHWQKVIQHIHGAYEVVAQDAMTSAAEELANASEGLEPKEVVVSCDNTWQRRGFQSKNGVSTVLSVNKNIPSKVIDVHISSTYCNRCTIMKNKLTKINFEEWYNNHKSFCDKNHNGTAGSMEPAGMEVIFRRSVDVHNLIYASYLGDGDSKSFHHISSVDPPIYNNINIKKLECCGHVQKRMGKKLMDKVKELKNKTFVENGKKHKGIGGKGKLTQATIKKLQGHYGAAIRKNVNDVLEMKKDIWAIFKHRGGDHSDCKDWCPATRGDLLKANKNILPEFILNEIKPIFEVLSATELLEKCSHGGTQNNNESFHHVIWQRCPKEIFVGRRRLEIAVYDALITFNEGDLGRLSVFERLGMKKGVHCLRTFQTFDKQRCENSKLADTEKIRAKRRQKSLNKLPNTTNDDSYMSGGF